MNLELMFDKVNKMKSFLIVYLDKVRNGKAHDAVEFLLLTILGELELMRKMIDDEMDGTTAAVGSLEKDSIDTSEKVKKPEDVMYG